MRNKKVALIGAKGMLAQAVARLLPESAEVLALDLPEFDLASEEQILEVIGFFAPELIVNCAAFTNVDGCETQEELATRVNGTAVGILAEAAKRVDAILVHISTDYVFPGAGNTPLCESDAVGPASAYGRSKLAGEEALVQSGLESYFLIRTSWLYGPGGNNFVETILRLAREREELGIVADQVGSPTYTRDLAAAIFNLLEAHESATAEAPYGIYHFSDSGQCSWYDFAVEIVARARQTGEDLKVNQIKPIKTEDYPLPATRPAYSVFSKEKYLAATDKQIPTWQESLRRYIEIDREH